MNENNCGIPTNLQSLNEIPINSKLIKRYDIQSLNVTCINEFMENHTKKPGLFGF